VLYPLPSIVTAAAAVAREDQHDLVCKEFLLRLKKILVMAASKGEQCPKEDLIVASRIGKAYSRRNRHAVASRPDPARFHSVLVLPLAVLEYG
jgi:hypothetical protein